MSGILIFCHDGDNDSSCEDYRYKDDQNALWVKSGNRGNLNCLKVNDYFVLIFHHQMFTSFLSDAKLPKVYD